MTFTRRDFLQGTAGLAVAAAGGLACGASRSRVGLDAAPGSGPPFLHGVASGDPLADRVILWTRVTPPPGGEGPLDVRWELASDPGMRSVVARGRSLARPEADYVTKVDAAPLEPGLSYYYRFDVLGEASAVGRTRTLPAGHVDRLRFGVCSCANYPQGHFNAYASLAARADLDAVIHLGDYIYEYGRDGYGGDAELGRDVDPALEILSLVDYRRRYAQYRSDPQLQAAHQRHPFIAVWDDHEIANNAWSTGAENHQPATEGAFAKRRAAAVRAYFEWMPIRAFPRQPGRIYRSFRFGDLADLVLLDTRLIGRDAPVESHDFAGAGDSSRTLLGPAQHAWLDTQLRDSQAAGSVWRLLGQQIMLAGRSREGGYLNGDSWDGYRASRSRLIEQLGPAGIPDVVTLTGDYHSSWAMDVALDPMSEAAYQPATGQGSVAVEFVVPAISSTPLARNPGVPAGYADAVRQLPHVRGVDLDHNGYVLLDVDRERVQAEWYFERDVGRPVPDARFAGAFATARGAHRIEQVTAQSRPRAV